MTSPYGVRPSRRTGAPTFHAGVDFQARTGDPVYAVTDGVVRVVRSDEDRRPRAPTSGYGHVIGLEHADGQAWSVYAHLSRVLVTEGETVAAGQLIGEAGSTSNGKFPGMGAHLHFEIRVPDGSRDPFPGPYRRWNTDPQAWLAARGIGIEGGITVDGATPARPASSSSSGGTSTPGIGRVVAGPGLVEDDVGLPDEPIRDPHTYDPPSPLLVSGLAALGLVSTAGTIGVLTQSKKL